jgi:hypothetical protein
VTVPRDLVAVVVGGALGGSYPIVYEDSAGEWRTGALGSCSAPTLRFLCAGSVWLLIAPDAEYSPAESACSPFFQLFPAVDLSSCGGAAVSSVVVQSAV